VTDELGANELSDNLGEVWCNCDHSVLEVLGKVHSVGRDLDDLVSECSDVLDIILEDLGSHGDLSGLLDLLNDALVSDHITELLVTQVLGVGTETNELDSLSVHDVVGDDLGKLGEVP